MASDRISATLFYPNTLAGAILLLLPPILAWICQAREQFTVGARGAVGRSFGRRSDGVSLLVGLKGGWLLALMAGLIVLLHLKFSKRMKLVLVGVVLAMGLAGFAWKYSGFFQRGARAWLPVLITGRRLGTQRWPNRFWAPGRELSASPMQK